MNRHLAMVATISSGAIAGLLGSLLGQRVLPNAEGNPPVLRTKSSDGSSPSDWLARRRASLEQIRLPQLRPPPAAEQTGQAEASAAERREAEERQLVHDPQKAHAAILRRWAEALAEHESEAHDGTWSLATGQAFAADLAALGPSKGFRFVAAQCKTTTCSARLEWPDYHSALQGSPDLLHHRYRTNCGTATTLPPPSRGSERQPYQMTMLYDCAAVRQRG